MTQPSEHGSSNPYFSEEDWQYLRSEDLKGAKAVVGLMMGIFLTGLVLYMFVAWWVA
jgi:hypothetical protein